MVLFFDCDGTEVVVGWNEWEKVIVIKTGDGTSQGARSDPNSTAATSITNSSCTKTTTTSKQPKQ